MLIRKRRESKKSYKTSLHALVQTLLKRNKQLLVKLLDKITLDDIRPSSRRYPFVGFTPEREVGNDLLTVEGLSKTIDGEKC